MGDFTYRSCSIVDFFWTVVVFAYPGFDATFTSLGVSGRDGPMSLGSHYTGQDHDGQVTLSSGIQQWTVPYTGRYRIEAVGAAGGYNAYDNSAQYRGRGARMVGTFNLTEGEIIQILVGQEGGIKKNVLITASNEAVVAGESGNGSGSGGGGGSGSESGDGGGSGGGSGSGSESGDGGGSGSGSESGDGGGSGGGSGSGSESGDGGGGGGGGGTFVVRGSNTSLIVAGGGGGLGAVTSTHQGCDANTNTSGNPGYKSWSGGSNGQGSFSVTGDYKPSGVSDEISPFQSHLLPLFKSEQSSCKTFNMVMSLIFTGIIHLKTCM